MDAKELRIGDWVNNEDGDLKVVAAILGDGGFELGDNVEDSFVGFGDCKPIPLTEEWLERFGLHESKYFCFKEEHCDLWAFGEKEFGVFTHIEYVHQLQNLYFALTGEELELKDV